VYRSSVINVRSLFYDVFLYNRFYQPKTIGLGVWFYSLCSWQSDWCWCIEIVCCSLDKWQHVDAAPIREVATVNGSEMVSLYSVGNWKTTGSSARTAGLGKRMTVIVDVTEWRQILTYACAEKDHKATWKTSCSCGILPFNVYSIFIVLPWPQNELLFGYFSWLINLIVIDQFRASGAGVWFQSIPCDAACCCVRCKASPKCCLLQSSSHWMSMCWICGLVVGLWYFY